MLLIDQTFGRQDPLVRERAAIALDRIRRAGATTLLVSHEEELIRRLADEVWWLHEGKLAGRGDPGEVLAAYRKHVAERLRAWGESVSVPLSPKVRRGDGRAEILRVETIGENGRPPWCGAAASGPWSGWRFASARRWRTRWWAS